jgi:amidase
MPSKEIRMPFSTATQQIAALKSGKVSSLELVDAAIARIQECDGPINAVVVRDFDRARDAAKSADKDRALGNAKPLQGIPMTVKEAFDVAGLPTTWGVPGNDKPASSDAVLVERLRAAGAIILGKTNIATMLADWQSANEVYGVTSNPWDPGKTAGGSSGGGAAAVAAGMIAVEFGSDLAGSLRIPAAFCGVFAHRPSWGIVPMRGFAPPMAPRGSFAQPIDQSTVGPIARSAEDLRLALEAVAGPDAPDKTAWRLALPEARHSRLENFRVIVLDGHPLIPTDNEIRAAMEGVAQRLTDAGCRVGRQADQIPDMKDLARTFSALLMALMGIDTPEKEFDDAAARAAGEHGSQRDQSLTMRYRDWALLDRRRLLLCTQWAETFAQWDVVLCPAAPVTAFAHDQRPIENRKLDIDGSKIAYDKLGLWTALTAPNGLPVTTVPIGLSDAGLPIGMQVIGPRLEDYTPIAFADSLERQLGYGFKPPSN